MLMREIILPLATGLAIFLFGMQVMRIGFENLFLEKVKKLLLYLTRTPLIGLITGTVTTALLQSSSAVTLLTISLANARVIGLKQALGIVLGANIGTVMTAELLAFQIEHWGLYFFLTGCVLFILPAVFLRSLGLVIGGFGLLFLGMETMQSIAPVLKTLGWIDALYAFGGEGIVSGVIAGTLLTAVIQSSTAATMMTMSFLQDQLFPLTVAIAMTLGSNIGTCITAVLGSIGTNMAAKRVAASHVLLNVCGVMFFIPFIPALASAVEWLTMHAMHQVAHAQLLFNVLCSLLVLPVIDWFEKAVIRCTPSGKMNDS